MEQLYSNKMFSDLSLLLCRNARDIWVLIFYSADLPDSLMSSRSFLVVSRIFCVSAVSDSVTFSFQFGFDFFFFSDCCDYTLQICVPSDWQEWTSGDLGGNVFFTFQNDVNFGFVVCGLCYVEVDSFYAHFLESFFFSF